MSWVKHIPVSNDHDVFDEDEEDINLQNKEWRYNMEKRIKDGYRDGIDSGKETSLQHGFNVGYREGAAKMVVAGQLKGIVTAMQCWCQLQQLDPPKLASVSELLRSIVKYEDAAIEAMQKAQQNLPASVGDITDSIGDLVMQRMDSGCDRNSCCSREGVKEQDTTSACQVFQYSSTCCSVTREEDLKQLLKCCMSLVRELGFPDELVHHLKQLTA